MRESEDRPPVDAPTPPPLARQAPNRTAVRYVAAWGWGLISVAIGAFAALAYLQQQMYGGGSYNQNLEWINGAYYAVGPAIPYLLVLGVGCLVFAGYQARAHRPPEGADE